MTAPNDAVKRLAAVMNILAREFESVDDDDLLTDVTSAGLDATVEANRIRGLLLGAVVRAKKEELANALHARRSVSRVRNQMPSAASERRAMLLQALERRPQVALALDSQHRDITTLSDADVEKVLSALDALGLLREGGSTKR